MIFRVRTRLELRLAGFIFVLQFNDLVEDDAVGGEAGDEDEGGGRGGCGVVGEAVDYCGGHSRIRVDGRECDGCAMDGSGRVVESVEVMCLFVRLVSFLL